MSTFSPNLQYEEVARGGDTGTWDTPTNSNWSISDLVVGGIATIPVNNTNIILSAAQFQCRNLTFNSTLTGSITVSFPSSFTKAYEIQNIATGSSAFTISMSISGSVGQSIVCPPGQTFDIFNDGTNIKFKNLPPVGTYMRFASASVPAWISFCTVPPYLPCTGGTFSAATYPALNAFLGGNVLPDTRGTVGADVDGGSNRLSLFGPPSLLSVIGDQNFQAHSHGASAGTESAPHSHAMASGAFFIGLGAAAANSGGSFEAPSGAQSIGPNTGTESASHTHAITVNVAGSGGGANVQPTTIVGITMIRAG